MMCEQGVVTVRGVPIGQGAPKICIPVLGRSGSEILDSARQAEACGPDVVEWRIDWFEGLADEGQSLEMLRQLRAFFGDAPLLVTFRSSKEGGERELLPEDHLDLLCRVIRSGCADLVDVELFSGEEIVRDAVRHAHDNGVAVILSSHDFRCTPTEDEMLTRLERMRALGCDIAKLAVMPRSPQDVLALLSATERMKRACPELPLVTMSMGQLGAVSRLSGEVFGSAMTFGSAGQTSAPGQIPARQLREILSLLHGGT